MHVGLKEFLVFSGTNRMCFQPYAHDEIVSIVDDRVAGSRAVEKDAVELASRKVGRRFCRDEKRENYSVKNRSSLRQKMS